MTVPILGKTRQMRRADEREPATKADVAMLAAKVQKALMQVNWRVNVCFETMRDFGCTDEAVIAAQARVAALEKAMEAGGPEAAPEEMN